MKSKTLFFAYKYKEEFSPEHVIEDLKKDLSNLEYGDVHEENYQVWEYPSGLIFNIRPDREVASKDYYALPSSDLWEPILIKDSLDKEKVKLAHEQFFKKIQSK